MSVESRRGCGETTGVATGSQHVGTEILPHMPLSARHTRLDVRVPALGSGMSRVLLAGMSGAGKSTVLDAVARRGYTTVDTDYGGWELPGALWDEPRMSALLTEHDTIAVSGTAQNQGRFYDRFEHVIYLYVPLQVLLDRVRTRTNNPYGMTTAQRADITTHVAEVEPLFDEPQRWNSMGCCRCRT